MINDLNNYCVVLCNGSFPQHSIPLQLLDNADKIICCDGATVKLLNYGKEPYAIVGDLDSLPDDLRHKYNDRVYHDKDQETNDLTKAVYWCYKQKIENVVILGATGLREDHTIGNVSLLSEYAGFINIKMVTDTGFFIPVNQSIELKSYKGQQISIFSITPETKITTNGLQYDVFERQFKNWYQGTLNEALADSFTINIDKGNLILYFEHYGNLPKKQI